MLSDLKVREIQQFKGTATLSTKFIRSFDKEWKLAVDNLRGSGVDLSKIVLVPDNVEYRNEKT